MVRIAGGREWDACAIKGRMPRGDLDFRAVRSSRSEGAAGGRQHRDSL
jgi:hypothetical protein